MNVVFERIQELPRRTRIAGIAAFVAGTLLVIAAIVWALPSQAEPLATGDAPNFSALLPADKTIESLGGWQRLTPPGSDPVYVYADKLAGVRIRVSQQALPESFKSSPDAKLLEVARGYSATNPFEANGVKAYSGVSTQGPQSVLFVKNDVLVLVFADEEIQDAAWISYINSLR